MAEQTNTPVVILGAGATKACGGPLTNEILLEAFRRRGSFGGGSFGVDYINLLERFLQENFHLTTDAIARGQDDYPALPLLLSLIDLGIDKGQPFKPLTGATQWHPEAKRTDYVSLAKVRRALEYAISAVLEDMLAGVIPEHHQTLISKVFDGEMQPAVISFNYDLIIDRTLQRSGFLDYGCDIRTEEFQQRIDNSSGLLLKLHGSLNWLYCPGCHRLEAKWYKIAHMLDQQRPCPDCGTRRQAVLITPTYFKDYRNPHLTKIWYEAEKLLRCASHVYFIGYSLPDDDVHITYLLKRSLAHLPASAITVVEMDKCKRSLKDNPVGSRYRILFGDGIDWHPEGMEEWLTTL